MQLWGDIGEHIAVYVRLVMCAKPVMLWVSFACLVLVSADSNGGSKNYQEKNHGDHHGSGHFYMHNSDHYEVYHSETDQHEVHNEVHDIGHDVHTPHTKRPVIHLPARKHHS